jgi:hypothetical protein
MALALTKLVVMFISCQDKALVAALTVLYDWAIRLMVTALLYSMSKL